MIDQKMEDKIHYCLIN